MDRHKNKSSRNNQASSSNSMPELPPLNSASKAKVDQLLDLLVDEHVPDSTTGYPMLTVLTTQESLETVPDIMSGRKRNKRWGAVFSLAVIPGLEENNPGPVSLPLTPTHFFDSDNIDDLKARLLHEVDKAVAIARLSKEDPDAFMHLQVEFGKRLQQDRAAAKAGTLSIVE